MMNATFADVSPFQMTFPMTYSKRQYFELEKRLAALLALSNGASREVLLDDAFQEEEAKKHCWTAKWETCGPLMTEQGCFPKDHPSRMALEVPPPNGYGTELLAFVLLSQHTDRDTAARYAVVVGVIKKLEMRYRHYLNG